jgi:hypothetical protein
MGWFLGTKRITLGPARSSGLVGLAFSSCQLFVTVLQHFSGMSISFCTPLSALDLSTPAFCTILLISWLLLICYKSMLSSNIPD